MTAISVRPVAARPRSCAALPAQPSRRALLRRRRGLAGRKAFSSVHRRPIGYVFRKPICSAPLGTPQPEYGHPARARSRDRLRRGRRAARPWTAARPLAAPPVGGERQRVANSAARCSANRAAVMASRCRARPDDPRMRSCRIWSGCTPPSTCRPLYQHDLAEVERLIDSWC